MRRVALLLSDENNPYQRQLVREAQAAAGADIELLAPRFAGGLGINQIPQIFEAMRATPRVDAILIMMVVGEGLEKTIEKVVREGIACVFLNRMPAFLARLRALRAGTLVGTVTPDQRRIGAIQAEQCLALCPNGGFALLVLGTRSTASAIERREGFVNAIKRRLEVHDLEGDWTQAGAENALRDWYRLGADRRRTVDIIVCQNDSMAEGVRAVLTTRGAETARIPILGCDGLPEQGQALVKRRAIAATVLMPPTTPAAVRLLRDHWAGRATQSDVVLEPVSYPALPEIRRS